MGNKLEKPLSWWLTLGVITCCFLAPSIPFAAGIPAIRVEQLLVLLVSVCMISYLCLGEIRIGFTAPFFFSSLLLFVYIFISCFIGGVKGYPLLTNNFFELLKPFEYMVIGLITLTVIYQDPDMKERILKVICYMGFISFLIAVSQFFNPFNINSYYIPIIAPTQYATLVDGYAWPRVIGLTSNPNVFGFLMTLVALASLLLALEKKQKVFWVYWGAAVMGVVLSQSRTGFVFLIVTQILYVIPYFIKHTLRSDQGTLMINYVNVVKFSVCLLMFLLVLIYTIMNSMFYSRILDAINFSESASVVVRLEHWSEYWEFFRTNIIFGIGPAKHLEFSGAADNEWLFLGMRFGIVGLLFFLFFLLSPLLSKKENKEAGSYYWLSVALIFGGMVFMLPAGIYYSMQTFPIFLMMVLLVIKPNEIVLRVKNENK